MIVDRATYKTVASLDELDELIKAAYKAGYLSVDTETTGLDWMNAELVGLSLSLEPGSGFYVPVAHDDGPNLPLVEVIDRMKPLLEHPLVLKIGQNLKYDWHILKRYGVTIAPIEDNMLLWYVLEAGKSSVGMDQLAARHLNYVPVSFKEVTGGGKVTFNAVPIDQATFYAAEDSDVTLRLTILARQRLARDENDGVRRVYTELEEPLLPVLANMEHRGIRINIGHLHALTEQFDEEKNKALDEAETIVGHAFNPASPQQVGAVLQRMGVEITDQTDTGAMATGVEVLTETLRREEVRPEAKTFIKSVLQFRKYNKLIGTYTEGLIKAADVHGKVHTSFNQASVETGRLSSSNPNIQNIPSPARTLEGQLIREAFVASPGHKLISADYSQVELRIAAHASGDDTMFDLFASGQDFHKGTAADMYGVPLDQVTPEQRRAAKTVNFSIIYGKTAWGLSRDLDISIADAEEILAGYLNTFPDLGRYMERAKEFAKRRGYVETLFGRRIWTPDIRSPNNGKRKHAERAAINAPIQGSAADIIKAAMIKVNNMLHVGQFKTRMLLQVHDELVFEAPDVEVAEVLPLIVATMETAVDYLDVPLVVDAKPASNWREAH